MISPKAGAATVPPKIEPVCGSSTTTAHSNFGAAAGAKPMKEAMYLVFEYWCVAGSTLLAVPGVPDRRAAGSQTSPARPPGESQPLGLLRGSGAASGRHTP